MGESNAVTMRRGTLPKETLLAAAAIYEELYGARMEDGSKIIPATFELVYMIGWAPGANQPAALERLDHKQLTVACVCGGILTGCL